MWDLIGKAAVALVAARLGWSVLKGLYGSFLAAALGLNLKVKKTGEWAGEARGSGGASRGNGGIKERVGEAREVGHGSGQVRPRGIGTGLVNVCRRTGKWDSL